MKELIFGLIGGTALLMYGVDMLGEGLEKASGQLMKKILSVLTGKIWTAFLVGTFLTALVQSSTAITVLTVGFVNAGLMKLPQAAGIIYGANIGTTITAQLMAFSFRFKLTEIALPVLGFGFAIHYFAKNATLKNIGQALMGFGLMFLGLKILNSGIPFVKENVTLKYFFEHYASIPVIGILLGAAATALVHSSSATVGLVMVLGQAGLIDLTTAICIMFGDNIGTCITAQLASVTANINARRAAWCHTLYNVIGVLIAALLLPVFVKIVYAISVNLQPEGGIGAQIANSHTLFNVFSAVIFLPITRYYIKFLELIIRDRRKQPVTPLDKLLLDTPLAAFKAAMAEIARSGQITKVMFNNVMEALYTDSTKKMELVRSDEEEVNQIQKQITQYVVDISQRPLSESLSRMVPGVINCINNVERIGDHAINLVNLADAKITRKLNFSPEAMEELKNVQNELNNMFDGMISILQQPDLNKALEVAKLEQKIDELSKQFMDNHILRLEHGKCMVESGVLFLDIVNYLERIADHIFKVSRETMEKLQGMPGADVTEYRQLSPEFRTV